MEQDIVRAARGAAKPPADLREHGELGKVEGLSADASTALERQGGDAVAAGVVGAALLVNEVDGVAGGNPEFGFVEDDRDRAMLQCR